MNNLSQHPMQHAFYHPEENFNVLRNTSEGVFMHRKRTDTDFREFSPTVTEATDQRTTRDPDDCWTTLNVNHEDDLLRSTIPHEFTFADGFLVFDHQPVPNYISEFSSS